MTTPQFNGSTSRVASPKVPPMGHRSRSSTLTGLISLTIPTTGHQPPDPSSSSSGTSPNPPPVAKPSSLLRTHSRTASSPPVRPHVAQALKSPPPPLHNALSFGSSEAGNSDDRSSSPTRRHSSDKIDDMAKQLPTRPVPEELMPNSTKLKVSIHKVDAALGSVFLDRTVIPWAEVGDMIEVNAVKAAAGEVDEFTGAESSTGGHAKKRKVPTRFVFKLEENNDAKMQKMITNSKGVSLAESLAQLFAFANRHEVLLSKVEDPSTVTADHLELYFTGQYLGRADMWRIGMSLENKCVHVQEKLEFSGIGRAEVKAVWVNGKKVSSALITSKTKTAFMSKSAQSYIFIQLCRETYEFDEDGERFYEKALYGFLPELFTRWQTTQTSHVVTIILFARVIYTEDDRQRLKTLGTTGEDALLHDPHLGWYKDFYNVVVDFESRLEWQTVIPELKREVMKTHAEILLNHHLEDDENKEVKIMGRLSFAHEGNVLECLNLVLNPFDENYIDRDLNRTGLSMLMVTPGSGRFSVSKQLLRLTTERMIDHGICLDLICLSQVPLHLVPLFSFWSKKPASAEEVQDMSDVKDGIDPLYFDAPSKSTREDVLLYTIAFWVYCSFYSKSNDRPFRADRFVPRCKMYEVQMLGLLEHDLTSVSIPMLESLPADPEPPKTGPGMLDSTAPPRKVSSAEERRAAMMAYDAGLFGQSSQTSHSVARNITRSRGSGTSLGGGSGGQIYSTSYQSLRLPTFEEKADSEAGSRASSYKDRDMAIHGGLLLTESGRSPRKRLGSTNSHTPIAMSSQTSVRLSQSPVKSLTSTQARTPAQLDSPTKLTKVPSRVANSIISSTSTLPVTPQGQQSLRHKPSKSSITSKAAPLGWLSRLTGRAAPSQAIAAVESASRHDVTESPTSAGAMLETQASPASGSPHTLPRVLKAPQLDIAAPTPPADPKLTLDIAASFSQPITIEPRRGPSADPSSRRRRPNYADKSEGPPWQSPEHRKTQTSGSAKQNSGSLINPNSGSWKAKPMISNISYDLVEINPCRPYETYKDRTSQARKWQHALPRQTYQHSIKWGSLCAAACLPLTTEYLPSEWERDSQFEVWPHDVDVATSFMIRPEVKGNLLLEVMRELASQRLSQNFQFITAPHRALQSSTNLANITSQEIDWRMHLRPGGASEVLKGSGIPLYLSTSNYVHTLQPNPLNGTITVECWTRKIRYSTDPIDYQCLVWPRQRTGYQTAKAVFKYPSLANRKAFSYLDQLITGKVEALTDDLKYWRTRFILIPSDRPPPERPGPLGEPLKVEEIHIAGARKVLEMIAKQRWKRAEDAVPPQPSLLVTDLDPSVCILDPMLMADLDACHEPVAREPRPSSEHRIKDLPLAKIAEAMRSPASGMVIRDLFWHRIRYPDSFTSKALIDWILQYYADVANRDMAFEVGKNLHDQGIIEHCQLLHGFMDGHYFFRLAEEHANRPKTKITQRWFTKGFLRDTGKASSSASAEASGQTHLVVEEKEPNPHPLGLSPPSQRIQGRKRKIKMSQTMIIDLDSGRTRRSDRAEVAILHSDIIHNPANGFHLELNWLGVSVGLLDESRQRWAREADRYGLRLVEAPVEQIKDVGRKCAYRACFPIKLALAPPVVHDLDKRLLESNRTAFFFEYAILTRKFGFVLDVEANTRYPDDAVVEYSYRKAVFDHSQFVHNTGVALVQCVGGEEGFLWSDNRLFFSSATRSGTTSSTQSAQQARQQDADRLRRSLEDFCADKDALTAFYNEIIPPLPAIEPEAAEKMPSPLMGAKDKERDEAPDKPEVDSFQVEEDDDAQDNPQEKYLSNQAMWV